MTTTTWTTRPPGLRICLPTGTKFLTLLGKLSLHHSVRQAVFLALLLVSHSLPPSYAPINKRSPSPQWPAILLEHRNGLGLLAVSKWPWGSDYQGSKETTRCSTRPENENGQSIWIFCLSVFPGPVVLPSRLCGMSVKRCFWSNLTKLGQCPTWITLRILEND